MEPLAGNTLFLKRMGIDTHDEPIVYMRADCHVCRSEGFSAHSRITVTTERASIIATLNVVRDGFVLPTEAGLSEAAWQLLDATPGQVACLSHPRPVESLGAVRAKIFGHAFQDEQLVGILQDMEAGRYTDIELSAFLTACAAAGMSLDEVVGLTRGMVQVGERVTWDHIGERGPFACPRHLDAQRARAGGSVGIGNRCTRRPRSHGEGCQNARYANRSK